MQAAVMRRICCFVTQKKALGTGIEKLLIDITAAFAYRQGDSAVRPPGSDRPDGVGDPFITGHISERARIFSSLQNKSTETEIISLTAAFQYLIFRQAVTFRIFIAAPEAAVIAVIPAEAGELDQTSRVDIMGTMGYSIPAAMGAKMAAPNKQVVAVMGDGAFQMSMQELATIKKNNVPLKILIVRNRVLGLVREYQLTKFRKRYIGVDIDGYPNFDGIAKAYDMWRSTAIARRRAEAERRTAWKLWE